MGLRYTNLMELNFRWMVGFAAAVLASAAATVNYLGRATSELAGPISVDATIYIPANVRQYKPPTAFTLPELQPPLQEEPPDYNTTPTNYRPTLKPFNLS